MKISFAGIHDIRFPYGTPDAKINQTYQEIKKYTAQSFPELDKYGTFNVEIKDYFSHQKTDEKLADKGIRIITPVENPYITADLLEHIDNGMVQQYVDQTKTELIISPHKPLDVVI